LKSAQQIKTAEIFLKKPTGFLYKIVFTAINLSEEIEKKYNNFGGLTSCSEFKKLTTECNYDSLCSDKK